MKIRFAAATLLLWPLAVLADDPFPGLKAIMTPQEFAASGLDKLLPIQVDVINGAIARHYNQSVHQAAVQIAATGKVDPAPSASSNSWIHFGLNLTTDWRTLPSLKARVTAWGGGNKFVLDNGQIWEGTEAIPYELPGKDIEIAPRPMGEFALVIDGRSTSVRVRRLK